MDESQEIDFIINTYEDIFSDFDSRDYDKKSLSNDFLSECRNASVDKRHEGIEVKITLPDKLRDENKEEIIKKRLMNHFGKHHKMLEAEWAKRLKKSLLMISFGIIFSVINTLINHYLADSNEIFIDLFLVIFEPASWFFLWEGLAQLMFEPSVSRLERIFYKKMSKVIVSFYSQK